MCTACHQRCTPYSASAVWLDAVLSKQQQTRQAAGQQSSSLLMPCQPHLVMEVFLLPLSVILCSLRWQQRGLHRASWVHCQLLLVSVSLLRCCCWLVVLGTQNTSIAKRARSVASNAAVAVSASTPHLVQNDKGFFQRHALALQLVVPNHQLHHVLVLQAQGRGATLSRDCCKCHASARATSARQAMCRMRSRGFW